MALDFEQLILKLASILNWFKMWVISFSWPQAALERWEILNSHHAFFRDLLKFSFWSYSKGSYGRNLLWSIYIYGFGQSLRRVVERHKTIAKTKGDSHKTIAKTKGHKRRIQNQIKFRRCIFVYRLGVSGDASSNNSLNYFRTSTLS